MDGDVLKSLSRMDLSALRSFRTQILAAMVLVAFALFFHRFIYQPASAEMAGLETRAAALEAEKQRISAEVAAVDRLERSLGEATVRLEALRTRLDEFRRRLPTERQVSEILAQVSSPGGEDGVGRKVEIVSVKPLEPGVEGVLTRLPFEIRLETSFRGFGDYLARIEDLERLMVVDNFMIESSTADDDGGYRGVSSRMYLSTFILGSGGGAARARPEGAPPEEGGE